MRVLTQREPDRAILRDFSIPTRISVYFPTKTFAPHPPGGLRQPLGGIVCNEQQDKKQTWESTL